MGPPLGIGGPVRRVSIAGVVFTPARGVIHPSFPLRGRWERFAKSDKQAPSPSLVSRRISLSETRLLTPLLHDLNHCPCRFCSTLSYLLSISSRDCQGLRALQKRPENSFWNCFEREMGTAPRRFFLQSSSRTRVTVLPDCGRYRFFESLPAGFHHARVFSHSRLEWFHPQEVTHCGVRPSGVLSPAVCRHARVVAARYFRRMLLPLCGIAGQGWLCENVRLKESSRAVVDEELREAPHANSRRKLECRAAVPSSWPLRTRTTPRIVLRFKFQSEFPRPSTTDTVRIKSRWRLMRL